MARGFDQIRVERHHGDRTCITFEHFGRALNQAQIAIKVAFQFEKQRDASGHEVAQLAQREDASASSLVTNRLDLRRAHLGESAAALGQSAERIIVMHHGLTIGTDLKIGLDAVARCHRRGESRGRILDHPGAKHREGRDGRSGVR